MKFSVQLIQKFLDPAPSTQEIPDILTFCGLEVEEVETWHSVPGGLKNFVTARVVEVWPHPNADHLKCTRVDAGEGRLRQVVCGAPNVAAGHFVILALEGAEIRLPEKAPFIIRKTKIRGEVSEGMICAEDELGLGSGHDGILVLPDAPHPGTPAADYFQVQTDTILHGNITPNRPDATSHLGLARDIYAVLRARGTQVQLVADRLESAHLPEGGCPIVVDLQDSEGCPIYASVVLDQVQVGPSPAWLRHRLESLGHKSVNAAVDIANLVMLELGQPLHLFDADCLEKKVVVRRAAPGEKLLFLDGVERTLSSEDLVIADARKAHCLAGIMGGRESAVSERTRRIFIEAAWFQPARIRRSVRHHKLHTEAAYRFERQMDPGALKPALARAVYLLQSLCGARLQGGIQRVGQSPASPSPIQISAHRLNQFLGTAFSEDFVGSILKDLAFEVQRSVPGVLSVTPPTFKPDIHHFEDVVEEVIRIAGYHLLPSPQSVTFRPAARPSSTPFAFRRAIAHRLAHLGLQEVVTNPMVNPKLEVISEGRVALRNPISKDMAHLRQSLLESMLPAAAHNIRRQQHDIRFFEWGRLFRLQEAQPTEWEALGFLLCGRRFPESWVNTKQKTDFYILRGYIQQVVPGLRWELEEIYPPAFYAAFRLIDARGRVRGRAGQVHRNFLGPLDVKEDVYFAEIFWEPQDFSAETAASRRFRHPPRYPEVRRDLAFVVHRSRLFEQLEEVVRQAAGPFLRRVILFDVYEDKNLPSDTISLAIGLIFRHDERTLTDEEVNEAIRRVVHKAEATLGAKLRQ